MRQPCPCYHKKLAIQPGPRSNDHRSTVFSDAIAQSFRHPSSVMRPIGHRYLRNILATLRKIWGICMNHLHGAPSGYGIGTPEVRTRTAFVPVHPSHPSQKSSPAGTKRALPPLQRRSLTVENTCIALIRKQKLRRFRNLTCGRRLHVFI